MQLSCYVVICLKHVLESFCYDFNKVCFILFLFDVNFVRIFLILTINGICFMTTNDIIEYSNIFCYNLVSSIRLGTPLRNPSGNYLLGLIQRCPQDFLQITVRRYLQRLRQIFLQNFFLHSSLGFPPGSLQKFY